MFVEKLSNETIISGLLFLNLKFLSALLITICMQAMAAIPKHLTANLLQIYKRNTNFQISTETAAIACMLLSAGLHFSCVALYYNYHSD
jgi:hypothetical protein